MEPMERIITRFTRALDTYDRHADAQQQICRRLIELLSGHTDMFFCHALEIGCGTGYLTYLLRRKCVIDELHVNDLCEACQSKIAPLAAGRSLHFLPGDAETITFPAPFDLIVSASTFQWMKDPARLFHKLAGTLAPGGMLAFSTFAPGNLEEVRQTTGCGLSYPTAGQLNEWLSEDFRIIDMHEEEIILTFGTPLDVLRHLKLTGVTATGDGAWTRERQKDFIIEYHKRYHIDTGEVRLTYRPLYVLAVKK